MTTIAASHHAALVAFCPPSLRYRHFRHLGLLSFVTWAEYSCKTLHKKVGRFSKIPLLSEGLDTPKS